MGRIFGILQPRSQTVRSFSRKTQLDQQLLGKLWLEPKIWVRTSSSQTNLVMGSSFQQPGRRLHHKRCYKQIFICQRNQAIQEVTVSWPHVHTNTCALLPATFHTAFSSNFELPLNHQPFILFCTCTHSHTCTDVYTHSTRHVC